MAASWANGGIDSIIEHVIGGELLMGGTKVTVLPGSGSIPMSMDLNDLVDMLSEG